MDKSNHLFEVYLRLRPPPAGTVAADRFLAVEPPATDAPSTAPTHIQLNPPNDRRRAIEKFAFTQVFEEDASQLDVFRCTGVAPLVEGVLAPHGGDGTDALLATLGVTGSGKSHTTLGSRSQRGLTQLALDVLFRAIGPQNMVDCAASPALEDSLDASDASEATLYQAPVFLESVFADGPGAPSLASSRAPTPMLGDHSASLSASTRRLLPRPPAFPRQPDVSSERACCDTGAQYAVVVSMYEVYNDRIFDLLTPAARSATTKEYRRRPLLFKSTELSPDRKVVAGLRKVVCSTLHQALLVLEAGLQERRVAGTGSNSVSSRSHGFFCIEVKKSSRGAAAPSPEDWSTSALTIVDLAGSERARDAKTAGATLAEAGKINESLMYLGQCLQMQSDTATSTKPNLVPFRQCKLTELLFSNSFPSATAATAAATRRKPQKAVMIVTADPHGDFNATSQILRYSALAREVTVPRIPSITQTILGGGGGGSVDAAHPSSSPPLPESASQGHRPPPAQRPLYPPGHGQSHNNGQRNTSTASTSSSSPVYASASDNNSIDHRITMEIAALEIARLAEELDEVRAALALETDRRLAAESRLVTLQDRVDDRLLELEQEVRDDCAAEFEQRLALDMRRWKAGLEAEKERGEEHWDRKLDVLERMRSEHDENEEAEDKENILVENLEEENERLRREMLVLRRELACRSPSKRKPLRERDDLAPALSKEHEREQERPRRSQRSSVAAATAVIVDNNDETLRRRMERMRLSSDNGSPAAAASRDRPSRPSTRSARPGGGGSNNNSNTGSPKKMRKLSPRKWEVVVDKDDDDMF